MSHHLNQRFVNIEKNQKFILYLVLTILTLFTATGDTGRLPYYGEESDELTPSSLTTDDAIVQNTNNYPDNFGAAGRIATRLAYPEKQMQDLLSYFIHNNHNIPRVNEDSIEKRRSKKDRPADDSTKKTDATFTEQVSH